MIPTNVRLATLAGLYLVIVVGCKPANVESEKSVPAQIEPPPAHKAEAGIGRQGDSLRDHNEAQQMISGPAIQYFQVRERVVFEIQIPQALNLYKAEHGRAPRSHEEFVQRVLGPNNIQLPELKEGLVYQFNPEKEELWVYPIPSKEP